MNPNNAYFHLMAKPSSFHCNIKCEYCFYLEKAQFFSAKAEFMSKETLRNYIKNYIHSHAGQQVDFTWQGGEPTLLGLDFFRKAVAYQQEFSQGKKITNSFQTNGIALNKQWARFFKENQFLIGISIDGLSEVHNRYRISVNGQPTFERVKSAVQLLQDFAVDFNTLTVVNNQNFDKGRETYLALKELGSTFMQFIPIVEKQPCHSMANFSVPPEGYGRFLLDVFNEWKKEDVGKIFVIEFDSLLGQWLGYPSSSCVHQPTCGVSLVVEANGDVYSCDHYVYPEYKVGNLNQQSLAEIALSDAQRDFGLQKKNNLSALCLSCDLLKLCYGGCPKHRIVNLPAHSNAPQSADNLHNYLCPSYQLFFRQTAPTMQKMSQIIRGGGSLQQSSFL